MSKLIVIFKTDNTIAVINPAYKTKTKAETEDEFLTRIHQKTVSGSPLEGCDYDFVAFDQLPDINQKEKWRRDGETKKIKIDDTIITTNEKITALNVQIDAELGKSSPDAVEALRLMRKLQKREYD